jgi:hypothetical protein
MMPTIERDLVSPVLSGLSELHREVVGWSVTLREAAGLTPAEVLDSVYEGRSWTFGEYVVYGEHRILDGRWFHLVECLPLDVVGFGSDDVGASSDRRWVCRWVYWKLPRVVPEGWIVRFYGTYGYVLPSESDRERILRTIREVRFGDTGT